MPLLPGTSWLPTMAPSSTTHLPPDLFLLVRLCPVWALTCQPVRSLPLKMVVKPASSNFSGLGGSARTTAARTSRPAAEVRSRRRMGGFLGGWRASKARLTLQLGHEHRKENHRPDRGHPRSGP